MALTLVKQIRGMCDEIVVTEDGFYNKDLKEAADTYLIHPRLGHAKNLNLGFRASSGDYVGILDSDVVICAGTLRDLCIPGRVVSGKWREQGQYEGFRAWCCVIPRSIFEIPRYAIDQSHEGLDGWLDNCDVFTWSDKIEFSHHGSTSYAEQRRLGEQVERERQLLHPNKEVSTDRHRARLVEDPAYRKQWENS